MLNPKPILQPLKLLEVWEKFVFPQEYLHEHFKAEVFEVTPKNPRWEIEGQIRCFTTQNEFNTAFYEPENLLVFPLQKNIENIKSYVAPIIREIEERQKNKPTTDQHTGVFATTLQIGDRFHEKPQSKEKFIVTYVISDHTFWAYSDRGNGKVFKRESIVFVEF